MQRANAFMQCIQVKLVSVQTHDFGIDSSTVSATGIRKVGSIEN